MSREARSLLRGHEPRRLVGRRTAVRSSSTPKRRTAWPSRSCGIFAACAFRSIHPPDDEGVELVEHLRRIGCTVEAPWPIPDALRRQRDVVAAHHRPREPRRSIQRLCRNQQRNQSPTLIAIVGYEDPSTLQLVLEAGALRRDRAPDPAVRTAHQSHRSPAVSGSSGAKPRSGCGRSSASSPACQNIQKAKVHPDGKTGPDRRRSATNHSPAGDGKAYHRWRTWQSRSSTQTSYCNRVRKVFSFLLADSAMLRAFARTTNDVGPTRLGSPRGPSRILAGFFVSCDGHATVDRLITSAGARLGHERDVLTGADSRCAGGRTGEVFTTSWGDV